MTVWIIQGWFDVKTEDGDEDDSVDLDLSDCLVCGDALRLQLNSGKWPNTALLSYLTCASLFSYLTYTALNYTDGHYFHTDLRSVSPALHRFRTWPGLCSVLYYNPYHCTTSLIYKSACALQNCTALRPIACTRWYNALYGTSMCGLHCGEGTSSLRRWSLIPECQSLNSWWRWVWIWVLSMSMRFGRKGLAGSGLVKMEKKRCEWKWVLQGATEKWGLSINSHQKRSEWKWALKQNDREGGAENRVWMKMK